MHLHRWSFQTRFGFTLRGLHSEPTGKPLLHVLHGNGFCSMMYQPLLEKLTPYFDLFLSDAQGHGDSDHGGAFVGWEHSAELALAAFSHHLPRFQPSAIYAMGHSFGGVLTALINSANTSPFQRVALLDPVLFPPLMLHTMKMLHGVGLYKKNPLARQALKRRQQWQNRIEAEHYLSNRGIFKGWHPSALTAYIDHAMHHSSHQLQLKCQPSREAEIFTSFPARLWSELKKPCSRTDILYGNHTYPFVVKAVHYWQQRNPAVQARQVEGGHCFMQQFPEDTARQLLQLWGLPEM